MNFEEYYYLEEALSWKNVHKLKPSRKTSGAYGIGLLDEVFKGKDRLIYDIVLTGKSVEGDNVIYDKVKEVMKGVGYYLKDFDGYVDNVVYRVKNGVIDEKNPTTVGKVLTKKGEVDLLKSYINDPIRNEEKSKRRRGNGYKVVVSRHPYDLYGMSTDRSWESCMKFSQMGGEYGKSMNDGVNKHYVYNDIRFGTLVAYLVSAKEVDEKTGKVALRRPLSRILMKPFIGKQDKVAYGIGRVYGNAYPEFKEFLNKWVKEKLNFDIDENEYFHLKKGLYDDGDRPVGANYSTGVEEIVDLVIRDGFNIDDKYREFLDVEMNNGNDYNYATLNVLIHGEEVKDYDWKSVMTYKGESIEINDVEDLPEPLAKIFSKLYGFSINIVINNGDIRILEKTRGSYDEERNGKTWDEEQEYEYTKMYVVALQLLKYIDQYGYIAFRNLIINNLGGIFDKLKQNHDNYLKSIENSKTAAQKYFEEHFVKNNGITKLFDPLYNKIKNKDISMYFTMNEISLKIYKETNDLELYKSNVKEMIVSKWDLADIEHINDFIIMIRTMLNVGLSNHFDTNSISDIKKKFFDFVNKKYDIGISDNFNNLNDIASPIFVFTRIPSTENELRDNLDNIREILTIKNILKKND